jgi:hypothetical protein
MALHPNVNLMYPPKAKTRDGTTHSIRERQWKDELNEAIVIPPQTWQEPQYDALHCAKVGLLLGALGGCTSLALNVIGSVLWPAISGVEQHPLRLIQVYLTFPLGESALQLNSGIALAWGCVLYLATGMVYGMFFVLGLSYFLPRASVQARLVACSVLALMIWAVNFYILLAWLQPLLFGGHWITELIPWWVAMFTHLIFGWTVAVVYPLVEPIAAKPVASKDNCRLVL